MTGRNHSLRTYYVSDTSLALEVQNENRYLHVLWNLCYKGNMKVEMEME